MEKLNYPLRSQINAKYPDRSRLKHTRTPNVKAIRKGQERKWRTYENWKISTVYVCVCVEGSASLGSSQSA